MPLSNSRLGDTELESAFQSLFTYCGGKSTISDAVSTGWLTTTKTSPCSLLSGNPDGCFSKDYLTDMANKHGIEDKAGVDVIDKLDKIYNCDGSLECIWKKNPVQSELRFIKIKGPLSDLISNVEVANLFIQWELNWPRFWPFPFAMSDYRQRSMEGYHLVDKPHQLAIMTFQRLKNQGREMCGCVINTDNFTGLGEHWMALFADWRDPSKPTVEFFNSSGQAPQPEYRWWLEFMAKSISMSNQTPAQIYINGTKDSSIYTQHQYSETECGVYSLFYIFKRLTGQSPEYFQKPVPDTEMLSFRYMLFDAPTDSLT